jgi:hypothetical protein
MPFVIQIGKKEEEERGGGGAKGFSSNALMWVFFSRNFPHKILHDPSESHGLATIHRSNDLCRVKTSA